VAAGIPVDESTLGDRNVQIQSVNYKKIGSGLKFLHRQFHGEPGSLIDIDPIYSGGVHGCYRPGYGTLPNSLGQDYATLGLKLLAVVEPPDGAVPGEDHCGGEHRPEQGATTDLVDTGYGAESTSAKFSLDGGVTADLADWLFGQHAAGRRYPRSFKRAALPFNPRR
jgi:hypothetical protein